MKVKKILVGVAATSPKKIYIYKCSLYKSDRLFTQLFSHSRIQFLINQMITLICNLFIYIFYIYIDNNKPINTRIYFLKQNYYLKIHWRANFVVKFVCYKMRFLVISLVALIIGDVSSEKVRFDNYRVYSVQIDKSEDFSILQRLENLREGFQIWNRPAVGQMADIVVPPHKLTDFNDALHQYGLLSSIKIFNIQEYEVWTEIVCIL